MLVVEDEFIVALDIERMLQEIGCEVVGPVSNISDALSRVENTGIDLAVLDVNVGGSKIFPVAEALRSRGIPFVFSTGYSSSSSGIEDWNVPVIRKPFSEDDLFQHLADCFNSRTGTTA